MPALKKLLSAHRRNHFVEIAVTKVYKDHIYLKCQGKDTKLIFLYLLAAFDTIYQDIHFNDLFVFGN